jgi:hypothetical protein
LRAAATVVALRWPWQTHVTMSSSLSFIVSPFTAGGEATLAQDISSGCELVHRMHPNPTFRDGHHRVDDSANQRSHRGVRLLEINLEIANQATVAT